MYDDLMCPKCWAEDLKADELTHKVVCQHCGTALKVEIDYSTDYDLLVKLVPETAV